MSKFVKIAAGEKIFSLPWFKVNAEKLFLKNKKILQILGFKPNQIPSPVEFTKRFTDMLKDPKFQDVVFAIAIELRDEYGNYLLKDVNGLPLSITPEQMFKDINYYYTTQGTKLPGKPGGSIAAGAYQSILFPEPRKEILPKDNVLESTIAKLKSITSTPGFDKKKPEEKKRILENLVKEVAGQNSPLVKFIDDNKLIP